MNSIVLWDNVKKLKELKIPVKSNVQDLCVSDDWAIIVTGLSVTHQALRSSSSIPKQINMKQSISALSCNRSMCLFLSSKGEIWVWGNDIEKYGIFGTDLVSSSDIPIKIESLANYSMISVSLGSSHAGAVCSSGLLYTWGTGKLGELGEISSIRSLPHPVNSANIFKSKQVVCGEKYTAICTEAGFVYIYGQGKKCDKCGGVHGFPYTIDSLQNSFLEKIWPWKDAIVSLSDTGKCFVIGGCKCIESLAADDKIHQIAVCSDGIVGLGQDKNTLYKWVKKNNEWVGLMYIVKKGSVESIKSGLGVSIGLVGSGLVSAELEDVRNCKKVFSDDLSSTVARRKSFHEILDSYGVKAELEHLNPRPMYKALEKCVNRLRKNIFKQVQIKTYSSNAYKNIYDSMRLPISLAGALGRVMLLQKFDSLLALKNNKKNSDIQVRKKDDCIRCCLLSVFKVWKQSPTSAHHQKIKEAACKILNDKLSKLSEKSKKFAFSSLYLHGPRNFSWRKEEPTQKRQKALINILFTINKALYKSDYCKLYRWFKRDIFLFSVSKALPRNNSNLFIDPRYKIEIAPTFSHCQEMDSHIISTNISLSEEYASMNGTGADSTKYRYSNQECFYQNTEPYSPSVDSTSPNSEQSPLITKLKELKSFKARVNQKIPVRSNEKFSSSAKNMGNDLKRNSFTVNTVQNNLHLEIMKSSKKSMTTKEPCTPPIFLKKALTSQGTKKALAKSSIGPLHLQMHLVADSASPFSKAFKKLLTARLSNYFTVIIKNSLQIKFVSRTPNARSNGFSSKQISDSWKMKLFSLGFTKLNLRVDLIIKKQEASAYNLLKLRIV